MKKPEEIGIDGHKITISHGDKLFFPTAQITKQEVVTYYDKIAGYMLPHIKDRMIVMHRYPDGIEHEGFYQKAIPDYFPSWIDRNTIMLKKGEEQTLVVIQKKAALVYLANEGVLVYHAWLSSIKDTNKPNKIVFDLDPSDKDISKLHFTAQQIKKILEHHKLTPFVMTTGSRGYHVVAPIKADHSFERVHNFVKNIAHDLSQEFPSLLTDIINKSERNGRIFIDYLRNSFGQTSVAPYSLREHEEAPVATPIDWDELTHTLPQQYTLNNIFKRLGQKEDPWKDFLHSANKLEL